MPDIIAGLIETGNLIGVLCAVMGLAMLHSNTRRVMFALTHFAKRNRRVFGRYVRNAWKG